MSDLTNYEINDTPMNMEIRSDTLEPISSSGRRFVFRLDQAGYLDQNSVLLFKAQNVANNQNLRANVINGGLGAIKRVIFQVGDYIINDNDGANLTSTLMNLMVKNQSQQQQYDSWYYQNQFYTKVLSANDPTEDGGAGAGNGTIVYNKQRGGYNTGAENNNQNGVVHNSCRILNDKNRNIQFGIPLGVIIPALKGRTIPLFLFQDYRILITVEFHGASFWVNDLSNILGTGQVNNFAIDSAITYEDVKLQVDYIIMPSEIQNKDREMTQRQGGLNLTFYDMIKVEKQIPTATANTLQKVEHRIGADNKEVHKIFMFKRLSGEDTTAQHHRLFGKQRCDGMNQEEYNVNVGGVDVYQENLFNPVSQYNELSNALGRDLMVIRPVYVCDDNTRFSNITSVLGSLLGEYKPLACDLSNGNNQILGGGRTIGAYPIIFKYERKPSALVANKTFALNGALECNYFLLVSKTANIVSSPSGTQVAVSY